MQDMNYLIGPSLSYSFLITCAAASDSVGWFFLKQRINVLKIQKKFFRWLDAWFYSKKVDEKSIVWRLFIYLGPK